MNLPRIWVGLQTQLLFRSSISPLRLFGFDHAEDSNFDQAAHVYRLGPVIDKTELRGTYDTLDWFRRRGFLRLTQMSPRYSSLSRNSSAFGSSQRPRLRKCW